MCGGMKSTPTSACEIQADLEPLGLRREKAALNMYERAKRMPAAHPTRVLVDKWRKKDRIKNESIMHKVKNIQSKCHLPEEREQTQRISNIPPHRQIHPPEVRTDLRNNEVNKKTDPIILKTEA